MLPILDKVQSLQSPSSEWIHLGTEMTNGHGKVSFTIPEGKNLGLGIYPMKMVVR